MQKIDKGDAWETVHSCEKYFFIWVYVFLFISLKPPDNSYQSKFRNFYFKKSKHKYLTKTLWLYLKVPSFMNINIISIRQKRQLTHH